ncbi:class I adenylate-forming enzyme family protein [Nocardia sp. NPDC055002]
MLTDVLRSRVRADGDRVFLRTDRAELTYRDVLGQLPASAERLTALRGAIPASVADDPLEAILFLFAACAAGAEPCLYPAGTDHAMAIEYAERFGHSPIGFGACTAARIGADGSHPTEPSISILTSGTTEKPKATRHLWRTLLTSAAQGHDAKGASEAVWLLAYNVNQYAGLQVLAHVLMTGATLVIPRGNRPAEALDAISAHGVTHISATPTFWRMLLASLDRHRGADPELRQITLGGEAASDPLLRQLRARFPASRISHIYATSEIGSSVAVSDGRAGLPLTVLRRDADDLVQFRVVEGELQVRSKVGMLGYHDSEIIGADWFSTGDLVELRDERIHFVGRVGGAINVGGVKVHPLQVEEVIAAVAGVELARVYGRPNPVTGKIVAAEVVAKHGHDPESVRRDVLDSCDALPETHRPRLVKMVDFLPLTQNKLDRRTR